jgi:hypothetical protein
MERLHLIRPVPWIKVLALAFCLAAPVALAQLPGGSGISAGMIKLFGTANAFTAKVDVQVFEKDKTEKVSTPMDFALLEDKVRVQLDLSEMKSKDMPEGAGSSLKQMGMANVISLIRPDKKATYIMYPDQKCMLVVAMDPGEAEAIKKTSTLDKVPLGKETANGHPCVKNKVTITDDKGQKMDAITWNATDLKDFPVQIQTTEKDNTMLMKFKQIQLTRPDSKQFELPKDYTEYTSQQALMFGIMKKFTSGEEK